MVAPLVLALAPILTKLAENGLDLIGSAILSKGKDVVENQLGVKIDETTVNDPAMITALQQAQMEHEAKLIELATADRKVEMDDLANARARDVALHQAGGANNRANWLAVAAIALVVGCLLTVVWSSGMDDFMKATITLILGRSLGWVEQIFSFEYGSTRSGRIKDETINKLGSK